MTLSVEEGRCTEGWRTTLDLEVVGPVEGGSTGETVEEPTPRVVENGNCSAGYGMEPGLPGRFLVGWDMPLEHSEGFGLGKQPRERGAVKEVG